MKKYNILLLAACVACAALVSACASTPREIVGTSTTTVNGVTTVNQPSSLNITNPTIVNDLESAAYNLDNAVTVGALTPDDPAPKCLHDVLRVAGIETPPGTTASQTFVPKNNGVASLGAIAYIQVQQAKRAGGQGITVAVDCKALIGQLVIDGATGLVAISPVGRLFRALK